MRGRSATLPLVAPMSVLRSELKAVEEAHDLLGLTYREIAAALKADESTLHRWRSAESDPSPIFLSRLESLEEFLRELEGTFRSWDAARRWLDREVEALAGRRPREVLLQGRLERVTGVLLSLNLGGPV
jgi:transcriptional regulator with XRE-family HTH domain